MLDENMKTENERIEKPAFNMAAAYLQRVNYILDQIADFSIKGRQGLMYNALKTLYREISPFLKSTDKIVIEDKLKQSVIAFKLHTQFQEESESTDHEIREEFLKRAKFQWRAFTFLLHEINMLLVSHIHKSGLLMPSKIDRTILGGSE